METKQKFIELYEILEYSPMTKFDANYNNTVVDYLDVKSFKRLIDGEIFSVGDAVSLGGIYAEKPHIYGKDIIKSIKLYVNAPIFASGEKIAYLPIELLIKHAQLPQPILTTEEGDKKYKGEKVWWVGSGGEFNMGEWVIDSNAVSKVDKYFSTELAAKGYQLLIRLKSLHEQGLKYINEYNK